ncbi:MAG TPA: LysM domain-containing protein, partial [Polyangia bacterium]|nr:LysM domain-containing protein [Polyangia bacterium]
MGRFLALVVVLLALAGCFAARTPPHAETPAGRWYVVGQGETLAEIAAKAGLPAEDVLELNGLERREQVTPGMLLFLIEGRPAG